MRREPTTILATAALLIGMAGMANASIVTNGDFSDGSNGWILLEDVQVHSSEEARFLNSGTGRKGRLIQKFRVPEGSPGMWVTFDYRANFGESGNGDPWDPTINPSSFFKASVDWEVIGGANPTWYDAGQTVLKTNKSTGWQTAATWVSFAANPIAGGEDNVRIRFEWNENTDWMSMAHLDNAMVSVPEPATLAIWSLLGFCGIGLGWRRRHKA